MDQDFFKEVVEEQIGTLSNISELLIIESTQGPIVSITFLNRAVGTTSRELEDILGLTSLIRSSNVIAEKFFRIIGLKMQDI